MLMKTNAEAVKRYKNARGPIEAKYTPDEIKDLITVKFEEMENFDELTRRAREMEIDYVEDLFDDEEEDAEQHGVVLHDVEDMVL